MQNARIFLIEDEERHISEVKDFLTHDGHEISLEAKTLREVMECIELGRLEEEHIRVVILDANIPQNDTREPFELWGPEIYRIVKLKYPSIKVVAYTTMSYENAKYGDEYVSKLDFGNNTRCGVAGLIQAIRRL